MKITNVVMQVILVKECELEACKSQLSMYTSELWSKY